MKKFFAFSVFVFAGSFFVSIPPASAAQRGFGAHVPTEKILEFTLTQIKDSLIKIQQQNEQIAFENDVLRRNIQGLQREKNFQGSKMSGIIEGSAFPDLQDGQSLKKIDQDSRSLRTQELIAIFEQDIKRLNEKSRILDNKLNDISFDSKMKLLGQREEMEAKKLARVEKSYEALRVANKAAEEMIKRLKSENDGLRQKLQRKGAGN